jgi:hypothetical protein
MASDKSTNTTELTEHEECNVRHYCNQQEYKTGGDLVLQQASPDEVDREDAGEKADQQLDIVQSNP